MSVDVEDESVLANIFKDSFPESWSANPDFAQYLAELSSYGIDKLSREPDRLSEERSQILEETQELAFHNYKTFIETAECSRQIFQDFQIIEKNLKEMLEKLPQLTEQCTDFNKTAQTVNSSRRQNNSTLQRYTQLLEILEMPQLMDTCVRNGYYEEALELVAHVKRLEKKHATIPVVQNIVNEVKACTQLMLNQLIAQLRTNLQLPACLRVIGYLRRMDVFTEAELRIKFLQARDTWFKTVLDAIPNDDPYYHITKTVEVSRVHLFDIITQYRAIFSDDDPLLTNPRDDGTNEAALFHGWVIQKVSKFLHALEEDLNRGVGNRLDSVLGQCMYFGLSFSRVGADFRGLLAPIFQRTALQAFSAALQETNQRFDEAMQSYTLLGTPSVFSSNAYQLASQGTGGLQPPMVLMEFPPLATYCNQLLTALNDLRLCAPLSLACDVASQIQKSLEFAANIILAYHRAEETTFNLQEKERFGQLCHAFNKELVVHLNRCLQSLFPPAQLAQLLGIAVVDLIKMSQVGLIDIKEVTAVLEHLVPERVEEVPEPQPQPKKVESKTVKDQKTDQSSTEKVSQINVTDQSEAAVGGATVQTDQSGAEKDLNSGVTDQSDTAVEGVTIPTDQSESPASEDQTKEESRSETSEMLSENVETMEESAKTDSSETPELESTES